MALAEAIHDYAGTMGLGGLCLRVQRAYQSGDLVTLALEIAGAPMPLDGVVSWARPGFVGIRFQPRSAESNKTLAVLRQALAEMLPPQTVNHELPDNAGAKPFAD